MGNLGASTGRDGPVSSAVGSSAGTVEQHRQPQHVGITLQENKWPPLQLQHLPSSIEQQVQESMEQHCVISQHWQQILKTSKIESFAAIPAN